MKLPLLLSQPKIDFVRQKAGFFVVASNGHIAEMNSTMLEWLGLSLPQIASGEVHYRSILSLDSVTLWEQQWQALSRQEFIFPFELTFKNTNGQLLAARISIMDFSGAVGCMIQLEADDVREVKHVHAPPAGEAQSSTLADAVPIQIYDLAPDGSLRYVNCSIPSFSGLDLEQAFKNGTWIEYLHPDDLEIVRHAVSEALQAHTGFSIEFRVKNRQGEYRWLLASAMPGFTSNGEFYGLVGSNVDITERKQAELALRESEERFRIMVNASPAMIFDMTPDGTARFVNQAAIDYFSPERLQDMTTTGNWVPEAHPDDLENMIRLNRQSLENFTPFRTELRIRGREGVYRWHITTGTPSFYSNGDFYGVIGYSLDISALKEAEFAMRESEERFRIMANASPSHIFEIAPDGCVQFINQTALNFFEQGAEEDFKKGNVEPYFHPEDLDALRRHFQWTIKTQVGCRYEIRAKRRDGQYRWLLSSLEPSLYPNGTLHGLIGSAIDITVRKEMEQALQQSEARWRELANAVPILLWVSNAEGQVIFMNDRTYQFSGLTREQLTGENWLDAVHPDDRELVRALVRQYSLGEPFDIECRYRRADGVYRWHLSRVIPIKDSNGKVLNWYGSSFDIHDRRIMEQELSKARDIAEDASQKKSQFLANMSHELRTPLNAVIGFSDMMKMGMAGPLTDRQDDYIGYIATSGRHLLTLVNDILDISKAEAGKIELSLQYVELEPFIEQLRDLVGFSAEKSGVTLTFEVESGLVGLVADSGRLKQIFLNLISNAIKFNHRGGKVNVFLSRSKDQQWVVCEVQDTGIGIPADKIDQLFTEFYQVDSSNARGYEGTGLGLALTKRLVELHHGIIMVESKEGIGSAFTLKLPVNLYTLG